MTSPRIVVITGATGGLGMALVRLHLEKGDLVIATGRRLEALDALQQHFSFHERLHVQPLDVRSNEAARQFAAWVQVRFGPCELLYNNAGTAVFTPLTDMRLEELEETLHTNIAGVMYLTRAFLPMMLQANTGHIVNVASLAGQVATAKAAVYAASKAAIIRFSEGLRHELADSGVHVTCAMPGPIDTPFLDRADHTGAYRSKVSRYLLTPEETAARIWRAVEKRKPEVAMPLRLSFLSKLYSLLPNWMKRIAAPLINRK
jgi:uncharacterized protein